MDVSTIPGPHHIPVADQGLTDALQRGVGPVGLGGAVTEDALDEGGGPSFPLVARVAGVAQASVEQRVVAHVDVSVGHVLGTAASCWHWGGSGKSHQSMEITVEITMEITKASSDLLAGANRAREWE